jgi:hypothetical protein
MSSNSVVVVLVLVIFLPMSDAAFTYNVSKAEGFDRRFDGVGGLSGGAAMCAHKIL